MEEQLVAALREGGYAVTGAAVPSNLRNVLPVVIQCFSASALQHLHTLTSIPLVLLLESGNLTYENLDLPAVAAYAQAVGPDKTALGSMSSPAGKQIVDGIHQAGILPSHIHMDFSYI
jgi:glycerophosphoryl diester phosphodiesterase